MNHMANDGIRKKVSYMISKEVQVSHCKGEFDRVRKDLRRIQDQKAKDKLKNRDHFEIVLLSH